MELLGTTDAAAAAAAATAGCGAEGGEKGRNVPRSDAKLALSEAAPSSVDCRRRGQLLLWGRGEERRGGSISLLCSLNVVRDITHEKR